MKTEFSQTVLLLGGTLDSSDESALLQDERFLDLAEDESDLRIEEAAIALARGSFLRGWRLAMRDDPVLTPLVIEVAREYWESLPGEEMGLEGRRFSSEPVVIFGDDFDEETREVLGYYVQIGCIKLVREFDLREISVDRVVCIGGSHDVLELLGLIKFQGGGDAPIYTIPSTGGGALRLYQRHEAIDLEQAIISRIVPQQFEVRFDLSQVELSNEFPEGERRSSEVEREAVPQFGFAFYPLVVNAILDADAGRTPSPTTGPVVVPR